MTRSLSLLNRLLFAPARLQELDKDFSDFTAGSSDAVVGHSLDRRGNWKAMRGQRYASKPDKENTLPVSPSPYPMGYPPFFPVPVAPGLWGQHPHSNLGDIPRSQEGILPGTRRLQRHGKHKTNGRDDGLFSNRNAADELTVHDVPESSESDLRHWLNRPDVDTRKDTLSGVTTRQRAEHIAKVTMDGRQAQSTVALHVE